MIRAMVMAALFGCFAYASAVADTQSPTGVAALHGNWLDKPIQLKFREIDLGKMLEAVGKLAGVTISVPAEFSYRVSFEMNDVPVRRALEVIGESQSLSYRQEGDTIVVQRMGAGGK